MNCDICHRPCIWRWQMAEAWWCTECRAVTFDLEEEEFVQTGNGTVAQRLRELKEEE